MKSLSGFLRTRYFNKRFSQEPICIESPVPCTDVSVKFSVHTWFEYHNRAHGSYTGEPDMVEWLSKTLRSGDVLWDIGSNVGAYSILAAKLCPQARVFAFEPFIPTFSHLWENIVLNEVTSQVFPVNVGLSDNTGPVSLAVNDPRAGSSQHQVGKIGGQLQQGVLAIRGDDLSVLLGIPAPTLLKLDIDGLEVEAMNGLRETLKKGTLREAMVEIEAGKSEDPVQQMFIDAGFRRALNPLTKPTNGVFNALFVRETQ